MDEQFLEKSIVHLGFGCNSNCVFCLQESREPSFFPKDRILKDISENRIRGASWLVLTGGEATIHKDFLDIVAFAKSLGFQRIQVITNGRMLSSKKFSRMAAENGLTEATISFHGSTPEKHDSLTCVPGSFKEASQAALNCRQFGIKLSFNTAISRLNALDLGNIVKYIREVLGFENFDYDLIGTAPQGRSWKHGLMPEHDEVKQGIKAACEYAEKHGIILWVTRAPIQDMPQGHQHHKEPWEVITHDTLAMWDTIYRPDTICDHKRCEYCEAEPYCYYIKNIVKKRQTGELDFLTGDPDKKKLEIFSGSSKRFLINRPDNAELVESFGFEPFVRAVFDGLDFGWEQAVRQIDSAKQAGIKHELEFRINKLTKDKLDTAKKLRPILSPTNPYNYVKYFFDKSNRLVDTKNAIMDLDAILKSSKEKFRNVPLCIAESQEREYWLSIDDFSDKGKINNREFVNRLVTDVRVYDWSCWKCKKREKCPGFFGDSVKLFGFSKTKVFV